MKIKNIKIHIVTDIKNHDINNSKQKLKHTVYRGWCGPELDWDSPSLEQFPATLLTRVPQQQLLPSNGEHHAEL